MRKIDVGAGRMIIGAIDDAIEEAQPDETVEFDFNGVVVQVAHDSDRDLIYRDWQRGMLRPSGTFTVTPYPPQELSLEQQGEDARLKREQEERRMPGN